MNVEDDEEKGELKLTDKLLVCADDNIYRMKTETLLDEVPELVYK
jgi:hypothetical protein